MSEFLLQDDDDLRKVAGFVCDHFENNNAPLKVKITKAGKRSLSQNALQHLCYGEISRYLVSKGRQDCNPEWVKKMLKNKYLGWVEVEYTDIETGEKTIHEELKPTSSLDVGEAYQYTTQIINWALDIGLMIKIPETSEYRQLQDQQNGIS